MTTFQQSHRPIKAREVMIGRRGEEPIYRIPNPKPVLEFHGWVLREKVKKGLSICLALAIGFLTAYIGWQFLVGLCVIGFVYGFVTGGDTETGP